MSKKREKKHNVIIDFISQTIFVMFLVVSIALFGIIISLGILPNKYLIIGLIVVGLLYFIIGFIIFRKRGRIRKIILSILCIGFIMLDLFLFQYLNSTLNFLDKIKAGNYQTENYYVISLKESSYNEINDITNLGLYSNYLSKYDKAISILSEKISFSTTSYNSYNELTLALYNQEIETIILSASSKEVLSDIDSEFEEKIKIVYVFEVKTESNVETTDTDVTEESFNIYISGIDVFGDISTISRSDVNMVVTVNPNTHKILLTSIPRDYYVQLHGTTGAKDKLTHSGYYGINMSIETIEDLLDIEIDYYVRVNFTTVVSLVDAIGGIEVYSDTAFTAWTDKSCKFPVGNVKLDGKCALAYSRERYAYIGGDRHRVQNQQDVIKAIIKKAMSSKTLITKYADILESMGESFQTNMPSDKIYALINKQLDEMPNWTVETYSLNGSDSSNVTYTYGDQILYVMNPNMDTVNEAKNKIKEMMLIN